MFWKLKAKLAKTHKSLTIQFNAVIVPLLNEMIPYTLEQAPQLQPYLPEDHYKTMMLILIVGNILIRFRTSQGLEAK